MVIKEGSRLARYASRIVRFLRGNDTLIDSLSIQSEDLNTIVARFDQMRNNQKTRIPIVIAYEMQPMFGMRFVRGKYVPCLHDGSLPGPQNIQSNLILTHTLR